jgi:CheY-like chemotaxis protein
MLRLVPINLLSNAVKYTASRAEAEIEIGMIDEAPGERLPVVVLTSSREESDLVGATTSASTPRSYDLGVNAYVVKPVNFPTSCSPSRQSGHSGHSGRCSMNCRLAEARSTLQR